MMSTFLGRLAEETIEKYGNDLSEICFVLPGRRAGLFLRRELAARLGKPIQSPDFYPVDRFFEQLANKKISDRSALIFELYLCWTDLRTENDEPFESFLRWAETALSDFNEIDNYLIDPEQIFRNLKEIRIMEEWSLDAEELTIEQQAYVDFWRDLGELYFAFQKHLDEKALYYSGRLKREVITSLQKQKIQFPWKKVIIAGLNALSESEKKLFEQLERSGQAEIYWDMDEFYWNDKSQEAADFVREFTKGNKPKGLRKDFLNKSDNIKVYGTASQIAQAKAVGERLAELGDTGISTAVVLSDESLLIPLLHSLPELPQGVNVTLGYPLKWSPLYSLIDSLLQMHLKASRNQRGPGKFYYKDILSILNHSYIRRLLDTEEGNLSPSINNYVVKASIVFPEFKQLKKAFPTEDKLAAISFLFESVNSVKDLLSILHRMIDTLNADARLKEDFLENEYLFRYAKLFNSIESYLEEYPFAASIEVLVKLMKHMVNGESIPFYGEPLQGLQIMGMLESRALDFERVILLGANENLLPKPKYDNSFIPFDLKMAFHLPTYQQRDAIYAYYFYRLITHAKEVEIYYNAEPGDFGAGEQSRFIPQLKHHLQKVGASFGVEEHLLKSPMGEHSAEIVRIPLTPEGAESLDNLLNYGLSPTALNTYLRCPLDFYFKYIAGLRESDAVEEQVEASTFGSAIHDTLEKLYEDYKGKVLKIEDIQRMKDGAGDKLKTCFADHYSLDELQYGSNRISFEIAEAYIHRFLDWEISEIKNAASNNQLITLLKLEEEYKVPIDLSSYGLKKTITIKGKADRIDKVGDTMRIIDYKTGSVEQSDLNFSDAGDLLTSPKKSKAVQLMLYLWMLKQSEGLPMEKMQAGIISLRKLSNGFMPLQKKASRGPVKEMNDLDIELFLSSLANTVKDIYDTELEFTHSPASEYCEFCE